MLHRPGQRELLGWERPWRRRYWPLKAKKPVTVQMPAYAAFRWDAGQADFFLIYDTGALPVRSYRPALSALADWRDSSGGAMPSVVVWTMTPERSHAWEALMSEVGQRNGGEPLPYVPLVPDGDDDL